MDDLLALPEFPSNVGDSEPESNSENTDVAGDEQKDSNTDGGSESPEDNPETDKAPAGDEGKKDDKKGEENPPEENKPKRKDKYQYIMERIQKRQQKAPEAKENHGEDEEYSPSDAETMEKFFEQKYGKDLENVQLAQFEAEQKLFLETNDLAKHATPAEKSEYMKLVLEPAYADLSEEEVLVKAMGYKRLIQIGAQQEKEASKNANSSKVGGSVGKKVSDSGATPDFNSMSDSEFEAYQHKVRTGRA